MSTAVSVVVPAFQAAAHIKEAIISLRAQRWQALDIVVVDDGSTDGTADIVRGEMAEPGVPLRLIVQDNAGAGAARDAGIAASGGDYILLADADDRADPDLVPRLVAALDAAGADLAYARCRYIDAAGRVVGVQDPQDPAPDAVAVLGGFMVNSPLVRGRAIRAIGGHDAALRGSIDLDLRLRLAMRRPGALVSVDAVLSDYRRSAGQITSDWRRMRDSWLQVRDKALAAGLQLTAKQRRVMHGRHCVYWATLAYMAGDFADARGLMRTALRDVPGHVLRDPQARIRAAACLTSLLPAPLHNRIRTLFNGTAEPQS